MIIIAKCWMWNGIGSSIMCCVPLDCSHMNFLVPRIRLAKVKLNNIVVHGMKMNDCWTNIKCKMLIAQLCVKILQDYPLRMPGQFYQRWYLLLRFFEIVVPIPKIRLKLLIIWNSPAKERKFLIYFSWKIAISSNS